MKEIRSLTGLRGIAAFYVMIYHYFNPYLIKMYDKEPNYLLYYFKNFISQGYLAVDLFFMLSSYVLFLRYSANFNNSVSISHYKEYMWKRFKRIYPLYLFSIIFILLFIENFRLDDFIINLLFLQAYFITIIRTVNVPTWSLSIEWSIYLILPFLMVLWQKTKNKFHYFFLIIVLFVLYQIQYLDKFVFDFNMLNMYKLEANDKINIHIGLLALIRGIIAYYIGFLIWKFRAIKVNKLLFILSLILILMELIININDVLIIIPLALFFNGLINNKTLISNILSSKPIHYLGQISFSLYLFHIIILNILIKYNVFQIPNNSYNIYLISIISSLIFSVITYEVIEKRLTKLIFK